VGAERARDLVGRRPRPPAPPASDAEAWAAAHGVLDEEGSAARAARDRADPSAAARAFAEALDLREALFDVLSASVRGAPAPPGRLATVNAALAAHASPPRLEPGAERLELRWGPEDSVLGPVLRSAAELLTGPELARVRECPGSPGKACGWLFVDRTKNGSRIWCVGTLCGNRTRAHRRYRASATPASTAADLPPRPAPAAPRCLRPWRARRDPRRGGGPGAGGPSGGCRTHRSWSTSDACRSGSCRRTRARTPGWHRA
jgi:predicted RNA-binding Zn ribbon-like protein